MDSWIELPAEQIPTWNQRLFQTDASVYQYPYWNESFRKPYFRPRYLVYGSLDRPAAYVCLLTVGFPGALIGLVDHGPVSLLADSTNNRTSALHDLVRWAKRRCYMFLRFTDSNHELIESIAAIALAKRFETFPFHFGHTDDLIVEQLEDDNAVLASFSATARKQIRKAQRLGYELEITDSPERFAEIWPLFQARAMQKGYRQPFFFWLNLMRLGREYGWARLYAAHWHSRLVHARLVVRDRTTAHCVATAINVDDLPGKNNESPSSLLQWVAMRDFYRMGVKYYSFGLGLTSWGQSAAWKQWASSHHKAKFHPIEKVYSAPVTIVTNWALYHAWSAVGLRAVSALWPRVRPIVRRLMVRS